LNQGTVDLSNSSLEKIACGDFFDTAPAFAGGKKRGFCACLRA